MEDQILLPSRTVASIFAGVADAREGYSAASERLPQVRLFDCAGSPASRISLRMTAYWGSSFFPEMVKWAAWLKDESPGWPPPMEIV